MTHPAPHRASWRDSLGVYLQRRVLVMALLGFSSGLPLQLTAATLQAWLTESGVSVQSIGLFGLVGIAYGWKFVWSPAVDGIAIPGLARLLGHRRAWMVLVQLLLAGAIMSLGVFDPVSAPWLVAAIAVVVAFLSATQDIVVDAFRVESLPEEEQAAGSALFIAAYRTAMLVSFTGTVSLVTAVQASGVPMNEAWHIGYLFSGGLVAIGLIGALLAREDWAVHKVRLAEPLGPRLKAAVVDPFRDFVQKDAWFLILVFVVTFKLGDAFTSELRTNFYLTMGFEKAAYSQILWPFGFFGTLVGGFAGGALAARLGLWKALWLAGLAQMLTNLVFLWPTLALPGLTGEIGVMVAGRPQLTLDALATGGWAGFHATATLAGAILVENFASGLGGIIFIAYLSKLCGNRAFTATQYALLSSLAGQARVMLSAPAGFVVAAWGWVWFYVIGTLLAAPGLLLLWYLWRRDERNSDPAPKVS